MDKDYLSDYQKHEFEEIEAFHSQVASGNFNRDEGYPPPRRFHKPNKPFAEAATYQASVWPQIPLCGSLLIKIVPRTKENSGQLMDSM